MLQFMYEIAGPVRAQPLYVETQFLMGEEVTRPSTICLDFVLEAGGLAKHVKKLVLRVAVNISDNLCSQSFARKG